MHAIINARIFTPEGIVPGHTIVWENGRIVQVCPDDQCPAGVDIQADLGGALLVPGFIDLQVNGGGGVLFNDDPSVEAIRQIGEAHRQYGTTGFFPTLISDDEAKMQRAIAAVSDAMAQGVPGVLGIHLEGPFLNPEKRGVHDRAHIRPLEERALDLLCSLSRGKTIVTLAPEMTRPDRIETLVRRGVIVCAGHSLANYEQTKQALDAGLCGFTHLFNAMPQLLSRDPGMIAAALEDARAWCGIIVDGHHVHPAMLRLALRAKTDGCFCLITDAMPSVGQVDKNFRLGDEEIIVENGRCVTRDGVLAGSDLDMMSAVRNSVEMLGLSLETALAMASRHPAACVGLADQIGALKPGLRADFVSLSEDLKVERVWSGGEPMHP